MNTTTMSPVNPSDDENKMDKSIEESQTEGQNQEDTDDDDDMTVTVREHLLFPKGPCEFSIHSAELLKEDGKDKVRIGYLVRRVDDEGEFMEDIIRRKFTITTFDQAPLMQLFRSLGLPKPQGKIRFRDLLGIIGHGTVKHLNLDNGDTIAVLDEIHR